MSQPIVVTLPHRLGKAEALRRLQASFSNAQSGGAGLFAFKNQGSGDHLDFRAILLGQSTTGTVDVAEDHVRLEVQFPWLLSMLANKAKVLVEKQGKLMLEKPVQGSARPRQPTANRLSVTQPQA
jgi:Putative polyhydroxyalkanoic acid system protein (PHA_gran_rgn)